MIEQPYYTIKPSLGGSFSYGWEVMKKNFLHLLVIVIVVGIASGPSGTFKHFNTEQLSFLNNFEFWDGFNFNFTGPAITFFGVMLGLFALAYSMLFLPIIEFGAQYMYVQAVRDEELDFKELINGFFRYTDIVLANLLTVTIVVIGFVMLIIPGIVCAVRLSFVPYLVMDKKLGPIEAVEESWRMTRGYGWTIFGMGIISILLCIVGLMFCFVGIIPALMWIHVSFASLYQSILNVKNNSTFIV